MDRRKDDFWEEVLLSIEKVKKRVIFRNFLFYLFFYMNDLDYNERISILGSFFLKKS